MSTVMTSGSLLDVAFDTLPALIHRHALAQPRHPALRDQHATLTYAELDDHIERIAAALQRDGILPQQAVAICAANSVDYAVVFLGCLRAGVTVAPLAPSSTAVQLHGMLRDAHARLLFLDADAAALLAATGIDPALRCIGIGAVPPADGVRAPAVQITALAAWSAAPGSRADAVTIDPAWAFNIIYSSGTTGTPKGIVQSHAMRWAHVQRGELVGYGPQALTLLATPLYSNTTLVSFFPTLALGGCVILMARFDARAYLALASQYRVTHTMLVPVQYQRILALPEFDQADLSAFQIKFCTSAPFAATLKAEVLRRWPGGLVEYYGMTEGGGTCMLAAHLHPDKLATVGTPAPGHDIRLIDERGEAVAVGQTGEVVGRSPAMMSGYFGQPQKTTEAEWISPEGLRFIRTGDIGRFDADGFLTLLDRKKDMVISGGFNLYPSDLEAVLREHPDLGDVAVTGVASTRWGETPVAFVVPRAERAIDADALLAWANARLGKMQKLAAVTILDCLPRSPIGKVLKRELRERFSAERGTLD
ncbi:MAG: acyl--CoA ligase [Pseudomonadota bacterium]|nr:acyl--CoA ligase [Pseudomonadota bacterium]